jgi:hypothetical protein
MINRLCKSPSCTFIIYNRNVVSIDRGGTEDTILNDKYCTVAPSGRIKRLYNTYMYSMQLQQKQKELANFIVLKIIKYREMAAL